MGSLLLAIGTLGVVVVGLMVMVGKLSPEEAFGRLASLIVVLIASNFAFSILEGTVMPSVIHALRMLRLVLCIAAVLAASVAVAAFAVNWLSGDRR